MDAELFEFLVIKPAGAAGDFISDKLRWTIGIYIILFYFKTIFTV